MVTGNFNRTQAAKVPLKVHLHAIDALAGISQGYTIVIITVVESTATKAPEQLILLILCFFVGYCLFMDHRVPYQMVNCG